MKTLPLPKRQTHGTIHEIGRNVLTFNNSQFGDLRANQKSDGMIWFCLSDVCNSLGLGNVSQTKSRLNSKGIITNDTLTKGGWQQMLYINEPNLYRCIFQSRKKEAELFQDWVVEEVLPAIRKNGSYVSSKILDLSKYVPIQRYNQLQQMYDFQTDQVRHWQQSTMTYLKMLERNAEIMRRLTEKIPARQATHSQPTRSEWMTVVGYATLHNISCGLNVAARLGRKAADLCARQGIVPDTIPDPRFGRVNTYPLHILEEVFNAR